MYWRLSKVDAYRHQSWIPSKIRDSRPLFWIVTCFSASWYNALLMLVRGTIRKIYDYYYDSSWYKDEVLRAFREFVGEKISKTAAMEKIGIKHEGYFNEWFLYDYVRKDGMTILEHFVNANPLQLTDREIHFYKTLLESNKYGLFEILRVEQMMGMTLKDLQTGEAYEVREMSATLDAYPGAVMFGRVADVGDHWELVGADTYMLEAGEHSWKKELKKISEKLTPKDAYELLLAHSGKM